MKKFIVPALAIALAISASAFTSVKKQHANLDSLKWFSISGNVAPTAAVPMSSATYLGEGTTPPAEADDCSGSSYQCVSGFNPDQVDGNDQLIDNSQHAVNTDARKN